MSHWRTETLHLKPYPVYANPALLEIETNGGRVEIQRLGSDGETWTAIATFDDDGSERIAVAGSSDWRIVAVGNAQFKWGDL